MEFFKHLISKGNMLNFYKRIHVERYICLPIFIKIVDILDLHLHGQRFEWSSLGSSYVIISQMVTDRTNFAIANTESCMRPFAWHIYVWCSGMSDNIYSILQGSDCVWICSTWGLANFFGLFFRWWWCCRGWEYLRCPKWPSTYVDLVNTFVHLRIRRQSRTLRKLQQQNRPKIQRNLQHIELKPTHQSE